MLPGTMKHLLSGVAIIAMFAIAAPVWAQTAGPAIPSSRASAVAKPAQPALSQEASTALLQMGEALLSKEFSVQVRTIRVSPDANGEPLHIFHTIDVLARRPDRLRVSVTGDDGSRKVFYDGKTAAVLNVGQNKYATMDVPETIPGMMEQVMGRLHVDFPLADFLTDAPNKAFLTSQTKGREINTVTIDGTPYRHLVYSQPSGPQLELWLGNGEQALPRRLVLTYRSLPGQPSFIAEFSNWNFSVHPTDAEFVFQAPENAAQVALPPPAEKSGTSANHRRN